MMTKVMMEAKNTLSRTIAITTITTIECDVRVWCGCGQIDSICRYLQQCFHIDLYLNAPHQYSTNRLGLESFLPDRNRSRITLAVMARRRLGVPLTSRGDVASTADVPAALAAGAGVIGVAINIASSSLFSRPLGDDGEVILFDLTEELEAGRSAVGSSDSDTIGWKGVSFNGVAPLRPKKLRCRRSRCALLRVLSIMLLLLLPLPLPCRSKVGVSTKNEDACLRFSASRSCCCCCFLFFLC